MTNGPPPTLAELRALLESALMCPHCFASNRPGVTHIELEELHAVCRVCSKEGPLADFNPEAH